MGIASDYSQAMLEPWVGMEKLDHPSSELFLTLSRDVEHISALDPIVEDQIIQYHILASILLYLLHRVPAQILIFSLSLPLSLITSHNAVPQHHLSHRSRDSVRAQAPNSTYHY